MKYFNVNPLDRLHPGEPFFFVRGQDVHAPAIIRLYSSMLNSSGDPKGAAEVHGIADTVTQWQRENPDLVKRPD